MDYEDYQSDPESPAYAPDSPAYAPISPISLPGSPKSVTYVPASPVYVPASPISPFSSPESLQYEPISPVTDYESPERYNYVDVKPKPKTPPKHRPKSPQLFHKTKGLPMGELVGYLENNKYDIHGIVRELNKYLGVNDIDGILEQIENMAIGNDDSLVQNFKDMKM